MKIEQKQTHMYALICDDWKYLRRIKGAKHDPLLCGVFSTEEEAQECANDDAVKGCMCEHYIQKVQVAVSYNDKQRKIKVGAPRAAAKKPRKNARKRA